MFFLKTSLIYHLGILSIIEKNVGPAARGKFAVPAVVLSKLEYAANLNMARSARLRPRAPVVAVNCVR